MRAIVGIVLIVAVLAIVGWVTFDNGDGQTSINFETEKAKQDVDAAIDSVDRSIDDYQDGEEADNNDSTDADPATVDPVARP